MFRIAAYDESDNERIPCELCDALIRVDDWESHSVGKRYLIHLIYFYHITENVY